MKKFLLSLGLASTLFVSAMAPISLSLSGRNVSVVTPTYAQCNPIDPICGAIEGLKSAILANFTTTLETLVQNIVKFLMKTIIILLGGVPDPSLGYDPSSPPKTMAEAYERYGALGAIGITVQGMYVDPPVTTGDYLATIHPIAPAVAAEVSGNQALTPISAIWTITRNLAYIFFVIILVAIGLMIMFRSRLDPRTTVTLTAALPGLIVSLLLITFSLAFAGFIIDIAKILQNLIIGVFQGSVGQALIPEGQGVRLELTSIWQAFTFNFQSNVVSLGDGIPVLVEFFIQLIILLFAFIVSFQVIVMLLFRYINLIVKPIFAPFTFLFGALPGKGGNMAAWFKSYLVDALTFPLVLFILNIAFYIKNTSAQSSIVGNDPFGVFGGQGANFNSIIAIGILFLATKVPALLEDALDIKPSPNVERAGAQPTAMAKQIPILRNFL